jgi:hypothetical protein
MVSWRLGRGSVAGLEAAFAPAAAMAAFDRGWVARLGVDFGPAATAAAERGSVRVGVAGAVSAAADADHPA